MRKKCNLILSIDIMKYKNDNQQIFYHCCCSWDYLLNTEFFIVDSKWKFQEKYFWEAHSSFRSFATLFADVSSRNTKGKPFWETQ